MNKKYLLFLLLLPLVYCCNKHPDWKVMDNAEFKIKYPQDWTLTESVSEDIRFKIMKNNPAISNGLPEVINLTIRPVSDTAMGLEMFSQLMEKQVTSLLENAKIVASQALEKGGLKYHKLIYTGDLGPYNLECEQYVFVKNRKTYILSYRGEPATFEKMKTLEEDILNSFELK